MDRDPLFDELTARVTALESKESVSAYLVGWPFRRVQPVDLARLTDQQREAVEALIASMLPAEERLQRLERA